MQRGSPVRVIPTVAAFALAALAGRADAAIDITGRWIVTVVGLGSLCVEITQTGSSLSGDECTPSTPFSGSIDVDTGVFTFAQMGGCGGITISATAAPDSNSFAGLLDYGFFHCSLMICGCVNFTDLMASGARDLCGTPAEECDDGNMIDEDCCSISCHAKPSGSACTTDGLPCSDDVCDGAGLCTHLPSPTTTVCRAAVGACDPAEHCDGSSTGCPADATLASGCKTAAKSLLLLEQGGGGAGDKLLWKWINGQPTSLDDLDDPRSGASYALCVHAGTTPALIASAVVPPSASKWKLVGGKAFRYSDTAREEDGIQKVLVKSSASTSSKAVVKGKGTELPDPPLGAVPYPVVVQLINSDSGTCLESTFDSGDELANDAARFKVKAQ
jgi:hypothetical protein